MNQFNTHCDLNGTMPIHQSTYTQFHSCERALIKIVNDAIWAMEHKNITILIIMGLSAAFDTVDHGVMLEVLHKCCGIEGMALEWFPNYVSSRFFKVNIGDACLNLKELNFSVPQGSCTGPSQFNAYSSSLANCIPNEINVSEFVDNHSLQKVFQAGDKGGEQRAINKIETCLINTGTWMNETKMNVQKMELMFPGS